MDLPVSDRYCESEPHGSGFRCPACLAPHRLDRQGRVPVRYCSVATKRLNERLKLGPCIHEGEPAGTVECRTCAGAVKIKTFACLSADVPQPRAAWSEKSLPEDVRNCGPCKFYQPLVTLGG